MRDKLVYICSPCRGDYDKNIQKAQEYCREAMEKWPDVLPIAPHVYFTQLLDDTNEKERELGMAAGIALLDQCDELWVYGIETPSAGMASEIAYAKAHGIPIRDAAELYRKGREQEPKDLSDVTIKLPGEVTGINGVAARVDHTVQIEGELIVQLAQQLRRYRGHNLTVDADQPEADQ
ncbi:MAG: DUF7768 domain-containing protein [Stomatobaculum sp.]